MMVSGRLERRLHNLKQIYTVQPTMKLFNFGHTDGLMSISLAY